MHFLMILSPLIVTISNSYRIVEGKHYPSLNSYSSKMLCCYGEETIVQNAVLVKQSCYNSHMEIIIESHDSISPLARNSTTVEHRR